MPSVETLLLLCFAAVAAVGVFMLVSALGRGGEGAAAAALSRGDLAGALEGARGDSGDLSRGERMAAAIAAKQLMRLDEAAARLDSLLREDPRDHEAALERGLVAAYGGNGAAAESYFRRAAERPDLTEALTLHRAWCELDRAQSNDGGGTARGSRRKALALFEEIEAPLETKLRIDLGTGDPEFAEWFLQAAALWRAAGQAAKAAWAVSAGAGAAPTSRLIDRIYPQDGDGDTDGSSR